MLWLVADIQEDIKTRKMREVDLDRQLQDVDKEIKRLQDKRARENESLRVILERSKKTQKEVKDVRENLVALYDISLNVRLTHIYLIVYICPVGLG